ncbi:MAG: aminotransferase class I/II-fold pyridoxal phosphate-dependent enzyme [Thiolinea sp.]
MRPAYPIHQHGNIIADADIRRVPLTEGVDFFEELDKAIKLSWPRSRNMLILNFPANPTGQCVELPFSSGSLKWPEPGIWVVHDIAYGEIVFDGYQAPSILQVPGAKDIAVEAYSLSKSYNMPVWLSRFRGVIRRWSRRWKRMKSYLDATCLPRSRWRHCCRWAAGFVWTRFA